MVMFNYACVSIWLNGKNLGKMDKFLSWRGSRTTNMAATTRHMCDEQDYDVIEKWIS